MRTELTSAFVSGGFFLLGAVVFPLLQGRARRRQDARAERHAAALGAVTAAAALRGELILAERTEMGWLNIAVCWVRSGPAVLDARSKGHRRPSVEATWRLHAAVARVQAVEDGELSRLAEALLEQADTLPKDGAPDPAADTARALMVAAWKR